MEREETHAFFFGVMNFLQTGRHLVLASAIDDSGFSAQTSCRTHGVHSCVAAAYHHHVLAFHHRRVVPGLGCAHQVDAREVLVAGHDADEVLARDVHEPRQACARCHEDARKSLLLQVLYGQCLAHDSVGHERHAQFPQTVNLHVHNLVGQTELGDAVFEHAAYLVKRLEDSHFVAVFRHISRESQTGRTGADDGYSLAVLGRCFGRNDLAVLALVVSHETLQIAYSHRLFLHLVVDALGLALFLLRAYATAHGGQGRRLFDDADCLVEMLLLNLRNEGGDVDAHRTTLHTTRVLAVQASLRLQYRLLFGQTLRHFFQTRRHAILRRQFIHLYALNLRSFLGCHALPPFRYCSILSCSSSR